MSEYASKSNRGALVGSVFAMQGVGIFFAAIVTMIVSACFQGYPESADCKRATRQIIIIFYFLF